MLELKPILSTLLRHKSSTFLIILQIAITFAVVVNASNIIKQRIELMDRDTGMANEQLLTFNINALEDNYDYETNVRADLRLLRSLPGVLGAIPIGSIPMSGNGRSSGVAASQEAHNNREYTGAGIYHSNSHSLNTLGVKLLEGRFFNEAEVIYSNEQPEFNSVIITKSLANKVYSDGKALGKQMYFGIDVATVVGIIERLSGPWVHDAIFQYNVITPFVELSDRQRFLIRAENKETVNRLLGELEQLLIERNRERVITNVRTMEEIISDGYSDDAAMMATLWTVIILLVLVTALGIVGIISFNVNQQIKQIGTRRALGATKFDIVRYYVIQNLLITSLGLLLGIAMTVGFNVFLAEQFEMPGFNWILIPMGVFIMYTVGIIAVWLPAQRASNVSPAIATQSI